MRSAVNEPEHMEETKDAHVVPDDTVLDARLRRALESPPLPDSHLALLAVLRHSLDLRAYIRHLLLLRLVLIV